MDRNELMCTILRDTAFYKTSGGGVTFSGGEPLLQSRFLRQVLSSCKTYQLHTAVDTAGNVPWAAFEGIIENTDLFLFDIKFVTSALHEKWTKMSNRVILENLRRLCRQGRAVWIRVPVIPGVNCGDEMQKIARFIAMLPSVDKIELLPYHPYGEGKYPFFGMTYTLQCEAPDEALLEAQKQCFSNFGLDALIHSH